MKQLTCEMCGSNDLVKQDGVFVCQSCGCKYSVEEAKKMMIEGTVEVTGTVKVEGINDAEKLYENAKAFIRLGEFEKSKNVLEELVDKYPDDYHGWWGMLELNTENFTRYDILNYKFNKRERKFDFIKYFEHAISTALDVSVKEKLKNTYVEWYEKRYNFLCEKKFNFYVPRYDEGCRIYELHINEQFYKDGFENAKKCNGKVGVFKALGFDDKDKTANPPSGYNSDKCFSFSKFIFVNGCIAVIEYEHSDVAGKLKKEVQFANTINRNIDDYLSALPDGKSKEEFKGACYVATCVYSSYDCPSVWTLRRFRDNTLAETAFGRAFIHTYYAISPTLVKWFGNTCWFKKMCRETLDKMISKLQANGVEDTPYQDRIW